MNGPWHTYIHLLSFIKSDHHHQRNSKIRPFGGGLVRSCLCLCVFAF